MKNHRKLICIIVAVCLLGIAAFCGFQLYHHYSQVDEQTEAFEKIVEVVEETETSAEETI